MNEYWPFIVLAAFGLLLYAGTIFWTKYISPDRKEETEEMSAEARRIMVIKVAQFLAAANQLELNAEKEKEDLKKLHLATTR